MGSVGIMMGIGFIIVLLVIVMAIRIAIMHHRNPSADVRDHKRTARKFVAIIILLIVIQFVYRMIFQSGFMMS